MKPRRRRAQDYAPAVLLGVLVLLSAPACQTGKRATSDEPTREPIVTEQFLPAITPFDGVAEARAEYLEAYRDGYRQGGPWFLAAPQGARVGERVDLMQPRARGWHDGAWAARLDAARNLKQETAKE